MLERPRSLGVGLVQAVHCLVQPEAELDLPARPGQFNDLQQPDTGGHVREEQP